MHFLSPGDFQSFNFKRGLPVFIFFIFILVLYPLNNCPHSLFLCHTRYKLFLFIFYPTVVSILTSGIVPCLLWLVASTHHPPHKIEAGCSGYPLTVNAMNRRILSPILQQMLEARHGVVNEPQVKSVLPNLLLPRPVHGSCVCLMRNLHLHPPNDLTTIVIEGLAKLVHVHATQRLHMAGVL